MRRLPNLATVKDTSLNTLNDMIQFLAIFGIITGTEKRLALRRHKRLVSDVLIARAERSQMEKDRNEGLSAPGVLATQNP